MAWTRLVSGSTAGNVSLDIDYNLVSVTRTSNSNVRVQFGIRFSMSTNTYTYNNIAAFIPSGGTRYYAFGNSGSAHTNKGTYYYATSTSVGIYTTETSPFVIDIPVSLTQTSASFTVGYGWNAYTPAEKGSSTIYVSFPTGATIPTGLSCSVSAITEDKATVSGSYSSDGGASVTSSGLQYSTDNSTWYGFTSNSTTLNAATKYYFRYYATNSQGTAYSNSVSNTTYDWPKPTSADNFTIGNGANVNLYNPLGRNVTLEILQKNTNAQLGSYSGTYNGNVNAEFKTTDAINKQYASIPQSKSGEYYAKVTYGSHVKYYGNGSSDHYTYRIAENDAEKPVFTTSNITNITNSQHTDINGTNKFIQGHNSLSGTIKKMTPQKSAVGDYYSISATGLGTINKTYSASNISFTLGNMVTDNFTVTAVDKREQQRSVNVGIDFISYASPSVDKYQITRQGGIGTKAIIHFEGVYTNWTGLLKSNIISNIMYRVRELPSGTYGNYKSLPSNADIDYSNGIWTLDALLDDTFDNTTQYGLQLKVQDRLETIDSSEYVISTADCLMWRDLENKRLGVKKKPDYELDVDGISNSTAGYSTNNVLTKKMIINNSGTTTKYVKLFRWKTTQNGQKLSGRVDLSHGFNATNAQIARILFTVCTSNGDPSSNYGYFRVASSIDTDYGNTGDRYQFYTIDVNSTTVDVYMTITGYSTGIVELNCRISDTLELFNTLVDSVPSGYKDQGLTKPMGATFDQIYPVGCIYLSVSSTNPGTLFGGTWQQISGYFLLPWDSNPGTTGGSFTSNETVLSMEQIPWHNHGVGMNESGSHQHTMGNVNSSGPAYEWSVTYSKGWTWNAYTYAAGGHTHSTWTDYRGSSWGHSHYHEPPWYKCYAWRRTA